MDFENVKSFVKDMYQNDKALERKKETLAKLTKQIQKEEAKLESKKIEAQKLYEEILDLEKKHAKEKDSNESA